MTPLERGLLRVGLGALLGAAWSLGAWMMLSGEARACFPAGIATGVIVTWLLTRTKLKHPILLGVASLPAGMMIFGTLLCVMHVLLREAYGLDSPFAEGNPLSLGLFLAAISLFSPYAVFFVPPAIGSTYLLALIFGERKPHRNRLLPSRWDG